jgi:hypothetical protein
MWHLGITAQRISPLKKLRQQYRCDVPVNKRPLIDKAALVMDAIERIARRQGLLRCDEVINAFNCWTVWGPSFAEKKTYLYEPAVLDSPAFRSDELYYTTLHKVHTTNKRFERNYSVGSHARLFPAFAE